MNTPEKNNYIQYVNKNGIVKAKNVVFDKGEETTTFTVSGIDEEFFIFAIYENNIQRFCVGIENLENTDMLGFINSNMVDLSCIPEYAFLQPQTSVEFSYNNEYVQNFRHGIQSDSGSSTDPDDLKYLKSLMSSLYPSANFTYIPHYVDWSNIPVFSFPKTMDMFIDSGKGCYFMTVYAKDTGAIYQYENKLKPFKVSGMSTSLVYDNFDNFPFLFTSFYMNSPEPSVGRFIAKGYKVISDIDLFN